MMAFPFKNTTGEEQQALSFKRLRVRAQQTSA